MASIVADLSIPPASSQDRRRAFLFAGLLLATLLAVFVARLRLLPVPLERDEGEFAYTGQLLLKGVPPYADAYTMKLPGVGLAYALFETLFGATASGIHLGLLLVNALAIGLVWLLGRRLFDAETASASAAIYALLSLSQGVLGAFAHATQFVAPLAVAGSLLMLRARDEGRGAPALASGILFGVAILMKQHAVLLAAFALLFLLKKTERAGGQRPLAAGGLFLAGTALPLLALALWLIASGMGDQAWFWVVLYPLNYVSEVPLATGLHTLVSQVAHVSSFQAPLWACAGVGAALLAGSRGRTLGASFLLGFLAFSFLATCPGLYFREHYFVLLLPALAQTAGFAVTGTRRMMPAALPGAWREALPPLLLLALIGGGLHHEWAYLFTSPPLQVSRDIYGPNPFPESPVIAAYLKGHSAPNDSIAVLGSEPQIYFDSDRISATGHIYMYGLMEEQPYALPMQRQMIGEIEARKPRFMVVVQVPSSWLMRPRSPTQLQAWAPGYLASHYRLVGIVDILQQGTQYRWDRAAAGQKPRSPFNVTIWRRTGAA